MADIFKLMEQFKNMQGNLQKAQEDLARQSFTGSAGGGMVRVECDGKLQVKRVKIDPAVVNPDDLEMLEELLVIATSEAQKKAGESAMNEMSKVTGGIELPFKLPF